MSFIGIVWEMGACVHTEFDADGYLTAQPDGLGDAARVHPYELHHPLGFAARAVDPEMVDGKPVQGKGCNLLIGSLGNENHTLLLADPRYVASFPPLKAGSVVQYACSPLPSFDTHDGENGTKTIYVEVGDTAHVITVGVDSNGLPLLSIVHSDGMAIILEKSKAVIKNAAGDCYIELGESGGTLNGNWVVTGNLSNTLGTTFDNHIHPTGTGPSGPATPGI
jgi:hypothetical protein